MKAHQIKISLVGLLMLALLACSRQKNTAVFEISVPNADASANKSTMFALQENKLLFSKFYVMKGANTGIELEFKKKQSDSTIATLKVFLPSGSIFEVYPDHMNRIHSKFPEVPFTFTEKDFEGITSRTGYPVKAYIRYEEEKSLGDNTSKMKSMTFERISITFDELLLDENIGSISCEFSGTLTEQYKNILDKPYEIKGSFRIDESKYEIKNLED